MTATKELAADPAARVGTAGWYGLTLLFLIFVANQIDRSAISAVQEQVKREFALTDGQLGLLTGVITGGVYGICIAPLAMLADRMNRRNLIAMVMMVWSLGTIACGLAGGFFSLALARGVVMGAESGGVPASTSLISDLFPPRRRASALAFYFVGASAGTTIAYLFAGAIAQDFGWRKAFWLAGAPGLVLAFVLLLTFREPKRGAMDDGESAPASAHVGQALRDMLANPPLLLLFLGGTLATIAATVLSVWSISLLVRDHGMNLKQAGFVVAMTQGLISGIGMAATGPLTDWVSRGDPKGALQVAAWTMVASTAAAVVFILSPTSAVAIAGLAACGLVNRSYLGPMISAVVGLSDPGRRALTVSVLNICTTCIGAGFGPYLAGKLSDAFGGAHSLQPAMLITVMAYLPGAALFVLAGALLRRRRISATDA